MAARKNKRRMRQREGGGCLCGRRRHYYGSDFWFWLLVLAFGSGFWFWLLVLPCVMWCDPKEGMHELDSSRTARGIVKFRQLGVSVSVSVSVVWVWCECAAGRWGFSGWMVFSSRCEYAGFHQVVSIQIHNHTQKSENQKPPKVREQKATKSQNKKSHQKSENKKPPKVSQNQKSEPSEANHRQTKWGTYTQPQQADGSERK